MFRKNYNENNVLNNITINIDSEYEICLKLFSMSSIDLSTDNDNINFGTKKLYV